MEETCVKLQGQSEVRAKGFSRPKLHFPVHHGSRIQWRQREQWMGLRTRQPGSGDPSCTPQLSIKPRGLMLIFPTEATLQGLHWESESKKGWSFGVQLWHQLYNTVRLLPGDLQLRAKFWPGPSSASRTINLDPDWGNSQVLRLPATSLLLRVQRKLEIGRDGRGSSQGDGPLTSSGSPFNS